MKSWKPTLTVLLLCTWGFIPALGDSLQITSALNVSGDEGRPGLDLDLTWQAQPIILELGLCAETKLSHEGAGAERLDLDPASLGIRSWFVSTPSLQIGTSIDRFWLALARGGSFSSCLASSLDPVKTMSAAQLQAAPSSSSGDDWGMELNHPLPRSLPGALDLVWYRHDGQIRRDLLRAAVVVDGNSSGPGGGGDWGAGILGAFNLGIGQGALWSPKASDEWFCPAGLGNWGMVQVWQAGLCMDMPGFQTVLGCQASLVPDLSWGGDVFALIRPVLVRNLMPSGLAMTAWFRLQTEGFRDLYGQSRKEPWSAGLKGSLRPVPGQHLALSWKVQGAGDPGNSVEKEGVALLEGQVWGAAWSMAADWSGEWDGCAADSGLGLEGDGQERRLAWSVRAGCTLGLGQVREAMGIGLGCELKRTVIQGDPPGEPGSLALKGSCKPQFQGSWGKASLDAVVGMDQEDGGEAAWSLDAGIKGLWHLPSCSGREAAPVTGRKKSTVQGRLNSDFSLALGLVRSLALKGMEEELRQRGLAALLALKLCYEWGATYP